MTMGSPLASASGAGLEEMNAIDFESGDQARRSPELGSGWLVPPTGASARAPVPSGLAMVTPSPVRYAIHWPSGDQRGAEARPRRMAWRVSRFIIQVWE